MAEPGGTITRRRLLVGGALSLAAVGVGVAGYAAVEELRPGGGRLPRGVVDGSFRSAKRLGQRTSYRIVYPPGHRPGDRLPVLVVLHGRGGDHTCVTSVLHLDTALSTAVGAGVRPFAVVGVDGGDRYWHARTAGDDSGAMVTDELLPRLAGRGLDVTRPAYLGYSMGGYGVLLLAERVGAAGVSCVVAESPALWRDPADSSSVAFDGTADFHAHDVFDELGRLRDIPVRIDCGTGDPFYPVTRQLVAALRPKPAGGFQPGAHTNAYWAARAPAQLRFVGAHLSA